MTVNRRWSTALAVLLAFGLWMSQARADAPSQNGPTSTPAQVDLFQAAPAGQQSNVTATPTRTATPLGPVQIEAKGTSNVRSQPDPNSDLLGQVRPGEFYNAIRRYYHWIEFQFDAAPTKRGWIFDELVDIKGDPAALPSVTSLDDVGAESANIDATVTGAAVTMTPGALLTATAIARTNPAAANNPISIATTGPRTMQIQGIDAVNSTEAATPRVVLPTYTYPPGVVAFAPTAAPTDNGTGTPTATQSLSSQVTSLLPGSFPPLVPIVGLAALGLLGLIVSSLRR